MKSRGNSKGIPDRISGIIYGRTQNESLEKSLKVLQNSSWAKSMKDLIPDRIPKRMLNRFQEKNPGKIPGEILGEMHRKKSRTNNRGILETIPNFKRIPRETNEKILRNIF